MAANFKRVETFTGEKPELFKQALQATMESGFNVKFYSEEAGLIQATSSEIGLDSLGEKITVQLTDGGQVFVKSECALPTQISSWGRNKRNVRKFFERFTARLN